MAADINQVAMKNLILLIIFSSLILIAYSQESNLSINDTVSNQDLQFIQGVVSFASGIGIFLIIEEFIPVLKGEFIIFSMATIIGVWGIYLIMKSINTILSNHENRNPS